MRDLTSLSRPERIAWAVNTSRRTLKSIAQEIGCTQAALSLWQRGKTRSFDAELMSRFADACGVQVMWLLYGVGEPIGRSAALSDLEIRALSAVQHLVQETPRLAEAAVAMLEAAASGKASGTEPATEQRLPEQSPPAPAPQTGRLAIPAPPPRRPR